MIDRRTGEVASWEAHYSHFYTANAAECAAVKGNRDWTYEGVAFYAKVPGGGQCASSDTPVYRAYNNRHGLDDQNHRFSTDIATAGTGTP